MPPKFPQYSRRTIYIETTAGQPEAYVLQPGEGGHNFTTADGRSVHHVGDVEGVPLYRVLRYRKPAVKPAPAVAPAAIEAPLADASVDDGA